MRAEGVFYTKISPQANSILSEGCFQIATGAGCTLVICSPAALMPLPMPPCHMEELIVTQKETTATDIEVSQTHTAQTIPPPPPLEKAPPLRVNLDSWKLKKSEKPSLRRKVKLEVLKLSILLLILSPVSLFQISRYLLFFPDQTAYDLKPPLDAIQSKLNTEVKEVTFPTANGKRLNGLYFKREGSKKIYLLNHGNAGNVAHRIGHAMHMLMLGESVFVYDYQGYGKSEGEPSVQGIIDDGLAAYDYVTKEKGWKPEQVIVYGESLGCAVACEIAKQRDVAAIVLQSGFASLPAAARDRFIWLNLFPDFTFPQPQLNNCQILADNHKPVLIIHGEKDPILSVKFANQMYDSALEPKTIVKLKTSGHNDVLDKGLKEYMAAMKSFLDTINRKT